MNRDKLIEYATVLQEYATSSWIEQPQFTTFKPALQLIELLSSYASYLSMQNKVMKLHHSSVTPSVNFSDASTVRYLPQCLSFSPLVKNLNDALVASDVYQIVHVNNFAPKSQRQRYLYVRELEKGFSVPCFFFTYSHGSNVGNYHFIWRAPEGVNVESSHMENMRDLIQEVSKLCPTGTPIPSKSWVQLNFCPRNPCTHSSKRYTSKLKAKHIVQKHQFRKSHPDSHYCAASFRYMRDYAVKYRNLFLFVCIDDKHTIKVGEPHFPLAAAERGREVVVSTSDTFVVGDHNFSKFKITPSVTLLVDIPDTIEGSFYTGQVFIGLKDSVFEPSSPIRHATELYKILSRRMNGHSILFVYSDGGTDCRLTFNCAAVPIYES